MGPDTEPRRAPLSLVALRGEWREHGRSAGVIRKRLGFTHVKPVLFLFLCPGLLGVGVLRKVDLNCCPSA